ncbi:MAG: hypothetical protein WB661_09655 [Candidatus Bathyarchaeia archaeon]
MKQSTAVGLKKGTVEVIEEYFQRGTFTGGLLSGSIVTRKSLNSS